MMLPGNSCRASRNHPANLRVPDSDGVLLQNSLRSIGRSCRSILRSKAATEKPFALRRGEYEPGPIVAGYRDLAVASSNPSATEAYCFCDQQGGNNSDNLWIADLSG
jgi:hypothetical protein